MTNYFWVCVLSVLLLALLGKTSINLSNVIELNILIFACKDDSKQITMIRRIYFKKLTKMIPAFTDAKASFKAKCWLSLQNYT